MTIPNKLLQLLISLVLTAMLAGDMSAQRNMRLFVPGTFSIGLNFAKIELDAGTDWLQKPGSAGHLQTGIGVRFKERIGLMVQGGIFFDAYSFIKPNAEYAITSYSTNFNSTLFGLIPIKSNPHALLHIGMSAGLIQFGPAILERDEPQFKAVTRSFGPSSISLNPEIGLTKLFKRSYFDMLLTYQYLLRDTHSFEIKLTDSDGDFIARGKGDYFGIILRYGHDIAGHQEPAMNVEPAPAEANEFAQREGTINQRITVKNRSVKLLLYDSGEEDQDSISVAVNGQYVLVKHELRKKPHLVKVRLSKGKNQIVIFAHNLGRVPPNTSKCELRSGLRKFTFGISTDDAHNEVIEVVVD